MPWEIDVDPRTLFLPTQRLAGADPWKLQQQIAKHGHSTLGMPAIWVEIDPEGRLAIIDGVTRATRVAKLLPGTIITVEVIGVRKRPLRSRVTVADTVP